MLMKIYVTHTSGSSRALTSPVLFFPQVWSISMCVQSSEPEDRRWPSIPSLPASSPVRGYFFLKGLWGDKMSWKSKDCYYYCRCLNILLIRSAGLASAPQVLAQHSYTPDLGNCVKHFPNYSTCARKVAVLQTCSPLPTAAHSIAAITVKRVVGSVPSLHKAEPRIILGRLHAGTSIVVSPPLVPRGCLWTWNGLSILPQAPLWAKLPSPFLAGVDKLS
jgi:hypothetical protein